MLSPFQIVSWLAVADEEVRIIASDALRKNATLGPEVADACWAVIDQVDPERANQVLGTLWELPQSAGSLNRCLQELRGIPKDASDKTQTTRRQRLQRVLTNADARVLREVDWNADENTSALDEPTRSALTFNAGLPEKSFDALWAELIEVNDRLMKESDAEEGDDEDLADEEEGGLDDADDELNDDGPEEDIDEDVDNLTVPGEEWHEQAGMLVRVLAGHPEAPARATEILQGPSLGDWTEVFCIEILGHARHAPAVPLLVSYVLDEDATETGEAAAEALGRIGTDDAVRSVVEKVDLTGFMSPTRVADALHWMHRPESVAGLMRLLRKALADTRVEGATITILADAFLCQCPTEPDELELLRQVINSRRWDITVESLDEMLLAYGSMIGYEPPEAAQWRKSLETRTQDIMAKRRKDHPDFAKLVDLLGSVADRDDSFDDEAGDLSPTGGYTDEVTMPIRRDEPKVGRNDPCPCGSGKKYKKCCLNKS